MWPITLSGRLPIAGLVGRYLTNYLIGRELTPNRISPFTPRSCDLVVLCGISRCFHLLSPCLGQIAHALLTRPPLEYQPSGRNLPINIPARLACVKHAASVRPEPGSNSDVQSLSCLISASEPTRQSQSLFLIQQASNSFESDCFLYSLSSIICIVFKDRAAAFNVSPSLATTYGIVSHPLPPVNPIFRLFLFPYTFGSFVPVLKRFEAFGGTNSGVF